MQKELNGRAFTVGRVLTHTDAYTTRSVTYRSDRFLISGVMARPRGRGPFPVLIHNHGYRDPETYVNGEGLEREQDYLARAGYVVVHTDYRNHATSDDDPRADLHLRLGYVEDALNAILALRKARLPYVDLDRVGMLGRSMGGGVTMGAAVVRPDLIDAAVLYAPVSSDTVDNFNKWVRPDAVGDRILRRYGSPHRNPRFWRNVSPRSFFDRITAPVLVLHGTNDLTCPISWTHETVRAMRRADVDVRLATYQGEFHVFTGQWDESIRRAEAFLDRRL